MCLATTYPPGWHAQSHHGGAGAAASAAASIADSSSFSVPSVIEQRANSHRVREVTERHVLLPMASSCEECDWDEPAPPVPTATNESCGDDEAESIDPILTMRDSKEEDVTMDGADSADINDDAEEEGVTICGVPLCDDAICVAGVSKPIASKRRGKRRKHHTNLDTIAEWRRQTSFSVSNPAQCMSITCGGGTLGRLGPIAEEQELEEAHGFRPLASVRNLFVRSRGGNDDDGIIAFRKCHSYRAHSSTTEPVERERYALADDIYEDEESVIVFSKPTAADDTEEDPAVLDDGTAKTEETEGDVSGGVNVDLFINTNITEPKAQSILDNLCTNFCGIFSLNSPHKQKKSSGSSVVSLSDETMAEEGGIFVVRNGTVREIDFGEDIAGTDEQLGIETSDRSYPGKLIEQSAKYVNDEIVHGVEDVSRLTFDGIAHVVKAMASTLTQGDVEEEGRTCRQDYNDEDKEDEVRTAEAREHANMVKDALQSIDRDDLLQGQASF